MRLIQSFPWFYSVFLVPIIIQSSSILISFSYSYYIYTLINTLFLFITPINNISTTKDFIKHTIIKYHINTKITISSFLSLYTLLQHISGDTFIISLSPFILTHSTQSSLSQHSKALSSFLSYTLSQISSTIRMIDICFNSIHNLITHHFISSSIVENHSSTITQSTHIWFQTTEVSFFNTRIHLISVLKMMRKWDNISIHQNRIWRMKSHSYETIILSIKYHHFDDDVRIRMCCWKGLVKEMKTRTVISSGKRPNPSDLGS